MRNLLEIDTAVRLGSILPGTVPYPELTLIKVVEITAWVRLSILP